jgi:hypothetical protein
MYLSVRYGTDKAVTTPEESKRNFMDNTHTEISLLVFFSVLVLAARM